MIGQTDAWALTATQNIVLCMVWFHTITDNHREIKISCPPTAGNISSRAEQTDNPTIGFILCSVTVSVLDCTHSSAIEELNSLGTQQPSPAHFIASPSSTHLRLQSYMWMNASTQWVYVCAQVLIIQIRTCSFSHQRAWRCNLTLAGTTQASACKHYTGVRNVTNSEYWCARDRISE